MFSQAAVASGSGTHIGYFVRGRKVPFVARPKETPPFTGFASTFNEKTGHAAVESVIAFALTLRSLLTKIGVVSEKSIGLYRAALKWSVHPTDKEMYSCSVVDQFPRWIVHRQSRLDCSELRYDGASDATCPSQRSSDSQAALR